MNLTKFYRAAARLLDAGWTIPEIERLSHFRSKYQQTSADLPDFNLDIRHLEFVRWLVQTSKLSDW